MIIFYSGALLALLSAFLFGVSPVLIKLISAELPPILMAGILYLGSGVGLITLRLIRRESIFNSLRIISGRQKFQLMGAVVSGGILAPICLTYGILYSSAFQVSALLNLETVATTILAGLIFREHIGGRVWLGKILIVLGAIFISMNGKIDMAFSPASLAIAGACIFWGMDNNLTRDIEDLSPSLLAGIKGFVAGVFNILLALILNQTSTNVVGISSAIIIGMMCYGMSLVFFIYALRKIGSSRTSTYFAMGPFIGMICSVLFLGERPALMHWLAGAGMLLGVWALYREHHEHEHTHEPLEHSHMHVHDEHHQHDHAGTEGPAPHEHLHQHKWLKHSHVHLPDIHHRHQH